MSTVYNMCSLRVAHHPRRLLSWTRRVYEHGTAYHKNIGVTMTTSGIIINKSQTVGPSGWQKRERSLAGGVQMRHESHRQKHKSTGKCGLSSELRKLRLEDGSAGVDKPGRHKSKMGYDASDEIVFGIAPCILALTQGRRKAKRLFVKDGEASQRAALLKVCEEALERGVLVQRVGKRDLDKMSHGGVHQGVCLQASPLQYISEDLAVSSPHSSLPLWLVLEGIQDPMNLGAILRSAYFLGVDRVCSTIHHSCPLSPVVSKASSGVLEAIKVYGYESLEGMLQQRAAQGWHLVGTVGANDQGFRAPVIRCSDFQMTKPTLLLIGNEGTGLSQKLLSLCQILLTIPAGRELMPGIESLNASVATGILLHSLLLSKIK